MAAIREVIPKVQRKFPIQSTEKGGLWDEMGDVGRCEDSELDLKHRESC